ncbi:MAG: mechanosensitive ion channel family protein [Oceanococcaceae bacterium]
MQDQLAHWQSQAVHWLQAPQMQTQLLLVGLALALAWLLTSRIAAAVETRLPERWVLLRGWLQLYRPLALPAATTLLLACAEALAGLLDAHGPILRGALLLAVVLLLHRGIARLVKSHLVGSVMRWTLLPLAAAYLLGWLAPLATALESMSVQIGNLDVTLAGVLRVLIFGSLLFWLGWVSNDAGQSIIRRQEKLDIRTREVMAKLFQLSLIVVVFLLLLQVMGIDLTALAVFAGAVGVGLGFGLQSIASNFISGIIILFERSVSLGDYVETADGLQGYVRELNMRHTTLQTFDGKDILVPNESFISGAFTNWTHLDRKQRYRVDFSVAYHTDVRALCELIKEAVGSHPQVLSGEKIPLEERPDCEIDSFGDSGINMFVEFWMEGIDDGRNRVGGDLLLLILETLQKNGIEIPFPQREVRVLDTPIRIQRTGPGES